MNAFVSIIRYVPDPIRGEAVNIGAVVACADLGYFRFEIPGGQTARLKCVDPGFSWEKIEGYRDWLQDQQEDFVDLTLSGSVNGAPSHALGELTRLSASDPIQVGRFRLIEFESRVGPAELDEVLRDLIERDVRWYKRVPAATDPKKTFQTVVGNELRRVGLYKPRGASPVKAKYRLSGIDLEFDYGYKNGLHHVIEAVDIRQVHDENQLVERAASVLVKYQRLGEAVRIGKAEAKRITIVSGKRKVGRATSRTIRELDEMSDLYYFGEDQERRRFLSRVEADVLHQG